MKKYWMDCKCSLKSFPAKKGFAYNVAWQILLKITSINVSTNFVYPGIIFVSYHWLQKLKVIKMICTMFFCFVLSLKNLFFHKKNQLKVLFIASKTPVRVVSYNANYFKIKFLPVQNLLLSLVSKGYFAKWK